MEENTKLLEALIVKQDDDKNTHEAERDAQDILRQELQSRIGYLEAELEQYTSKLKVSTLCIYHHTIFMLLFNY